jgi:hypothetical protein
MLDLVPRVRERNFHGEMIGARAEADANPVTKAKVTALAITR